jgi:SpoVK/Ycf46/Vps4 family AAA+-type ATPase
MARSPLVPETDTDTVNRALERLEDYAEILKPADVDEPILAPGVAHAVHEWLVELNNARDLVAVGIKPRHLALLYGPPGTGKTTLAHHLAARLGLPLVAVQSEKLVSKYVGQTGEQVGKLFELLADVEGACVLLLDEFDSLGATRTRDKQAAAQERNSWVAILLRRIESFRGVGLAATNTKDAIDPAMWRRFGLQISVDLPGEHERFAILRKYATPFDLDDDAIDTLVSATRGCSPSLLRQLMEGMKRSLVLAPKLHNLDITKPEVVFGHVIASIAPPPEMDQPPLWASPAKTLHELKGIAWPPRRS